MIKRYPGKKNEARTFLEERLAQRGSGKRAGGTRGSISRRKRDFANAIFAKLRAHALLRDQRLDQAGEQKTENQAPCNLPERPGGQHERLDDRVHRRQR